MIGGVELMEKKGAAMSELEIKPENYYLDVLQNPDYYLTGEKPIYKKVIKEAYSREQVLKLLESQLTIPKSIAEQADKTDLDTLFKWGQQEFYQWFNHEQDEYMPIIYAYLAGKALGVDLVKVVEG